MLNYLRYGKRKEERLRFESSQKHVNLSFFHEVEDPRRVFQMPLIDLSNLGFSIEVNLQEVEKFDEGDYLRLHSLGNHYGLARICYINPTDQNSSFRVGLLLEDS